MQHHVALVTKLVGYVRTDSPPPRTKMLQEEFIVLSVCKASEMFG